MQQYGLDGVFVQRFVSELSDNTLLAFRNQVLMNVKASAEKYGRTFAVMYDTSGANNETFDTVIQNDWQWMQSKGILASNAYQYHNDRAVVVIWGFGFSGRNISPTRATNLIHWLRAFPTVPMGGVPYYWRTQDHDSDPGWMSTYEAFEILSPWAVGRYSDQTGFDNLFATVEQPDVQFLKTNNLSIDYAPVIWPGFSWANLQNTPSDFNAIPRQSGAFFCYQAAKVLTLPPLFVYVAMFDEVNEGTAMLKAAPAKTQTPVGGATQFLYLNVDGGNLPSDHYLTLGGQVNKAMRERVCPVHCSMKLACSYDFDGEAFRNTTINRTFNVY